MEAPQDQVKSSLNSLNIKFKTFEHPPVYTCEQAEEYTKDIRGIHSKNLFIKDHKSKRYYLVILQANKKLDMKQLGEILNEKIKFANENDLREILNLTPGSVSPFGLINDKRQKVEIVIDKEIYESDFVSFHPNTNTETLELTKVDFKRYIESLGNKLRII